jgi:hypothetical protein
MAEATFSLDLHVLGPPLTFALSQDQTLHRKFEPALRYALCECVRGTALTRNVEWFRFSNTKPTIFERLAIQFSETDSVEDLPAPGWGRGCFLSGLDEFVEGVCL